MLPCVKWELIILGLLCCFNLKPVTAADKTLLFVQILYRHGDRAPITLYKTDPNPQTLWVEGLSKLTQLGRRQHYALGKYFRSMYENFITGNPLEINVTSGDVDRCFRSALTNTASFFAPPPEWKFDAIPWQPIPVYYIPKIQDKYLEDAYCPQADVEQKKIIDSPFGQAIINNHLEMFNNLTIHSGQNISNWIQCSYLFDTLKIERYYNLTIPTWALPWLDEMKHISDMSFFWSYNSPLMLKLRTGPLFQLIIEKMNEKIAGNLPNQKVQVYSAHDTNVAQVLVALKLYNMIAPPYCSSVIFELYDINGSHALRLLHQNSTDTSTKIDPLHVLILEGCEEYCPLEYFIDYTKKLIPQDWDKECELEHTFLEKISNTSVSLAILFATLVLIIVGISIFGLWRLHKKGKEKYSYSLMPMN